MVHPNLSILRLLMWQVTTPLLLERRRTCGVDTVQPAGRIEMVKWHVSWG